jgi:hypothetical protein
VHHGAGVVRLLHHQHVERLAELAPGRLQQQAGTNVMIFFQRGSVIPFPIGFCYRQVAICTTTYDYLASPSPFPHLITRTPEHNFGFLLPFPQLITGTPRPSPLIYSLALTYTINKIGAFFFLQGSLGQTIRHYEKIPDRLTQSEFYNTIWSFFQSVWQHCT